MVCGTQTDGKPNQLLVMKMSNLTKITEDSKLLNNLMSEIFAFPMKENWIRSYVVYSSEFVWPGSKFFARVDFIQRVNLSFMNFTKNFQDIFDALLSNV